MQDALWMHCGCMVDVDALWMHYGCGCIVDVDALWMCKN